MATTADKKMIYRGAPFAWVHEIAAGVVTELWRFNNLADAEYKLALAGAAAAGGENIDSLRSDGVTWRVPKVAKILSQIDETDITPAGTGEDATNKGEITITLLEAAIEANSDAAFMEELNSKLNSKFLITIATGFSYAAAEVSKKPDGFVHMIGKISTELTRKYAGNTVSNIVLNFKSYKNTDEDVDEESLMPEGDDLFTAITWKLGGAGDPDITPPPIIEADATAILAGEIVIVPNITYT
jgi:hypothetical protein